MPKIPQRSKEVWEIGPLHVLINKRLTKITGYCLGLVGVHISIGTVEHWTISSVTIGWRLLKGLPRTEAFRIGEALHQHCSQALSQTSPETMRAAFDPLIVQWLKECQRSRRCLQFPDLPKQIKPSPSSPPIKPTSQSGKAVRGATSAKAGAG